MERIHEDLTLHIENGTNEIVEGTVIKVEFYSIEILVQLLSPLSPHIAEEMWQCLGHDTMLAKTKWPVKAA